MARLGILVQGELDRLKKYNLFTATTVVLLLWVGMTWLLEAEEIAAFVPLILLMDSTAMTVALVGATLFYEKKEHTINSILVTPVREAGNSGQSNRQHHKLPVNPHRPGGGSVFPQRCNL